MTEFARYFLFFDSNVGTPVKEYIAALRRYVYADSCCVPRDILIKKAADILNGDYGVHTGIGKNDEQIVEMIRNDELLEFMLKEVVDLFFTYLPNDVQDKLSKTTFAVMNTLKAEAYAIKLSDEDYIVIVSFRLCKIFHYYTQTKYLMGLGIESSKNMLEKITEAFTDKNTTFPKQTKALMEHNYETAAMLECTAMELFVILHEYAHIYLGHLDDNSHSDLTPEENHKREILADFLTV